MSEENKVLKFPTKLDVAKLNISTPSNLLSVEELLARRDELMKWQIEHRIYVHPKAQAGKADFSYEYMVDEIIKNYQNKVVQNRYSVMKPLKYMFFYESKDRWLKNKYGDDIYSEIKTMFVYSLVEEMQRIPSMVPLKIIEIILDVYGYETHNVIFQAFNAKIPLSTILNIREQIKEIRIKSNSPNQFRDLPFNDSYPNWGWVTDELIGTAQDRFLLRSSKLPRVPPVRFFPKVSEEIKAFKRRSKPTKEGREEIAKFLEMSFDKKLQASIKKDREKLQAKIKDLKKALKKQSKSDK